MITAAIFRRAPHAPPRALHLNRWFELVSVTRTGPQSSYRPSPRLNAEHGTTVARAARAGLSALHAGVSSVSSCWSGRALMREGQRATRQLKCLDISSGHLARSWSSRRPSTIGPRANSTAGTSAAILSDAPQASPWIAIVERKAMRVSETILAGLLAAALFGSGPIFGHPQQPKLHLFQTSGD